MKAEALASIGTSYSDAEISGSGYISCAPLTKTNSSGYSNDHWSPRLGDLQSQTETIRACMDSTSPLNAPIFLKGVFDTRRVMRSSPALVAREGIQLKIIVSR